MTEAIDRQFAAQEAEEIRQLLKKTAENIAIIGQKLIAVKARLPHGQWGAWVRDECELSERTAQNFMNVAERFKSENFADLKIEPSALYRLAAPSTPKDISDKVITRAKAGERITHKATVTAIKRHESKPVYEVVIPEPTKPAPKTAKPAKNTAMKEFSDVLAEDLMREGWDFPLTNLDKGKREFLELALALRDKCPQWLADATELIKPDAELIEIIEGEQKLAREAKRMTMREAQQLWDDAVKQTADAWRKENGKSGSDPLWAKYESNEFHMHVGKASTALSWIVMHKLSRDDEHKYSPRGFMLAVKARV